VLDKEVKRDEHDVNLLRVKVETGLEELGEDIDVDVALVNFLLGDQAGYECLGKGEC